MTRTHSTDGLGTSVSAGIGAARYFEQNPYKLSYDRIKSSPSATLSVVACIGPGQLCTCDKNRVYKYRRYSSISLIRGEREGLEVKARTRSTLYCEPVLFLLAGPNNLNLCSFSCRSFLGLIFVRTQKTMRPGKVLIAGQIR